MIYSIIHIIWNFKKPYIKRTNSTVKKWRKSNKNENMIKAWITDYLGALLRFTYYKYVKREKVIYSNFLTGVNTPRTKVDKALYDNNYGKNRMWCAVFLLILAGILGICFS